MDCQFLKHFVFAFSVAALVVSPSYSVSEETLYTICSQTQNEEICVRILQSDPSTIRSVSLPQLSLISINLTRNQAKKNYQIFWDLRKKSTSSPLKAAYGNCVTIYSQMMTKISEAYQLSLQGRYKDIHQLGEVLTLAYKCENGLPSSSGTAPDTETMILTGEASSSVNSYIASYSPPQSQW